MHSKNKYIIIATALVISYLFSASGLTTNSGYPYEAEKKIQDVPIDLYSSPHGEDPLIASIVKWEEAKIQSEKEIGQMNKELLLKKYREPKKGKTESFIYEVALRYQTESDLASQTSRSIMKWSEEYGIDPLLVLSTGIWESKLDHSAVGTSMDTGIMQVIPSTGKWIAETLGYTWDYSLLYDIDTNIRFGTYYLKVCFDFWEGKSTYGNGYNYMALIGYNRGTIRTFQEFERGAEVTIYAEKVLPIYNEIKKEFIRYK